MTIKTWRNDILNICKNCRCFEDSGKSRNRYRCYKWAVHIYKAYKCDKLTAVMEQASKISKKALDDDFKALTTMNGKLSVND